MRSSGRSSVSVCALGLLALLGAVASTVFGQAYPAKPIKIIMPTGPGSPPDHAARVLAQKMGEGLGQAVIVENRGGAGGTIGAAAAAKSPPDGYTVMMGSVTSLSIGPALFPAAGIDPVKMFTPISQVALAPSVIGIPTSIPATTLAEFIGFIKANPGKYNYGSPPPGSPPHVSGALFLRAADIQMVHVPYGDPAKVIAAVLNGDVQLFIETLASIGPQVRSGKMRVLAVAAAKRMAQIPDVPTAAEAGLTDFESGTWSGLLAPAGTPGAIIQRLNSEAHRAADTREMHELLAQQGGEVVFGTPEQFGKLIAEEALKWSKAVAMSGAKGN